MCKLPTENKTFLPCFPEKQDETLPSEHKPRQISNQLLPITTPEIALEQKWLPLGKDRSRNMTKVSTELFHCTRLKRKF